MIRAEQLHVVGAYSNPRRYNVRPKLLREWVPRMLDAGVSLTVVEHAFGERPYEFSKDEPNFKHVNLVQLRGGPEHELWLQHALYNVGFSRLPETANYINWQDTDIDHQRKDWATETVHMLQHHRVGQTWASSVDLGPDGSVVPNDWGNEADRSFSAAWRAGDVAAEGEPYGPPLVRAMLDPARKRDTRKHTGYSWAIRRDALKGIGRLIDWMAVGSEDWFMAHGFAGLLPTIIGRKAKEERWLAPSYLRRLSEFAALCHSHIRQDVGVVPGTITHYWHGPKRNRFYGARNDIIKESGYDPDRDIVIDFQGLPTLCTDNRILRDGSRRYGVLRNEDSIDL